MYVKAPDMVNEAILPHFYILMQFYNALEADLNFHLVQLGMYVIVNLENPVIK